METTGCRANFAGLEQGETICPIPMEPFYADFDYLIYISRISRWSNEFTREDDPLNPRQGISGDELITEGDYQITFKVDGKGHKLYLVDLWFEKL